MQIALCQFNPIVGHIALNAKRILEQAIYAKGRGAELAIFPELAICGYPPRDLLLRQDFHDQVGQYLKWLSKHAPIPLLLGAPVQKWNAAVLCDQGQFRIAARKTLLPNYGVFDEHRYFQAGTADDGDNLLRLGDLTLGISICEDIWNDATFWQASHYEIDPIERLVQNGAQILVNLAASPFTAQKPALRESMLRHTAKRHKRPLLMVGQVGANDHLIFDGASCAIDQDGQIIQQHKLFEEGVLMVDTNLTPQPPLPIGEGERNQVIDAITLAIRDYVRKSGMKSVLIGLSGGIDSAVTAALAVRALGPENVHGIRLPSQFSSSHSMSDAQELADNLHISLRDIDIEPTANALREALPSTSDLCDQNLQARTRGVLLMALSNLSDSLVLSTGNKSELAMGYATLYGDMCGALAPLGDLYKTQVYEMARCLNEMGAGIPLNTINKPPSAELKKDQTDQDTLPPYEDLDALLKRYIESDLPLEPLHRDIVQTIHRNEYKRNQSAIVPMVSERQFGDSRRWPIAYYFDSGDCQTSL